MDEACDQDATVAHPAPGDQPPRIKRAHEEFARERRVGCVWTVPVASGNRIVGAITFERPRGQPADLETLLFCEHVASLAGPILAVKRAADARVIDRLHEFVRVQLSRLFGPDHPTSKAVAVAVLALLAFLTFSSGDYRITAAAALEGRVQRAIVAGLEGYIAEANVRAGDLVQKGQILGQLDERDLVLEKRKWAAKREQLRKEQREALAGHERTQVAILRARLDHADAQLELLTKQLARARLVAPFDGIVVKGDLSQSLGSPVSKGDVLFELAPLEGYRIILKVDDRDVSQVTPGQSGELALSALPGEPLALTVERVTPVSTAEEGRNFFRVEARLEKPAASLRPGMEGIAKIDVDRRRLLWILTHELVDWLRLWVWSWWA
jgi:RND family efflux transporter MFP subunit